MSNMNILSNPLIGTYNLSGVPQVNAAMFDASLKAFYITPILNATDAEYLYDYVRTVEV